MKPKSLLSGLFRALGLSIILCRQTMSTNIETASFTTKQGGEVLSVEAPRPLDLGARTLANQYHLLITYEDPRYSYSADIVDRAPIVRTDYRTFPPGKAPTLFGPIGGNLSVSFTSTDASTMLQQLIQAQNASPTGGRFQIETTGSMYHLVPTQVRDANGNWDNQQSILDIPISIVRVSRTANELLSSICEAVAQINLTTINIATAAPRQTDEPPRYSFSANSEPARNVLIRALTTIAPDQGQLTWALYYDVQSRQYFMNFLPAPVTNPISPSRVPQIQPQSRPSASSNASDMPPH